MMDLYFLYSGPDLTLKKLLVEVKNHLSYTFVSKIKIINIDEFNPPVNGENYFFLFSNQMKSDFFFKFNMKYKLYEKFFHHIFILENDSDQIQNEIKNDQIDFFIREFAEFSFLNEEFSKFLNDLKKELIRIFDQNFKLKKKNSYKEILSPKKINSEQIQDDFISPFAPYHQGQEYLHITGFKTINFFMTLKDNWEHMSIGKNSSKNINVSIDDINHFMYLFSLQQNLNNNILVTNHTEFHWLVFMEEKNILRSEFFSSTNLDPWIILNCPLNIYESQNKKFLIQKIFEDGLLLIFIKRIYQDDKNQTNALFELGIMTSSIAHELNNPLANIFAAIELLLIILPKNSEPVEIIEDMKVSALKCKQLIEIFLGFSKKEIPITSNESHQSLMMTSFEQGFNLLRTRMLENKIQIVYHHKCETVFALNLNSSILVIIFYLIGNHMITQINHQDMIQDLLTSQIELELIEKKNEVLIRFNRDLNQIDSITNDKFLFSILSLSSLSIETLNDSYRLKLI